MAPWPSSADGSLSGSPEPVAYSCPCRAIQTRRWRASSEASSWTCYCSTGRTWKQCSLASGLAVSGGPAGDGHVGVVDLDKTSTVPIDDRLRSPHPHGHGVAVLLKIYAHCIDGQATAANQRIAEALGTRDTEQDLGDEGDGDMEQAS